MEPDTPILQNGIYLTMPLWPDTPEPTLRQILASRRTVCLDPEAGRFAHMSLGMGGHMSIMRIEKV